MHQVEVACNGSISIHALLAESDMFSRTAASTFSISIHALLAESDLIAPGSVQHSNISIHALLAESDQRPWRYPQTW